MVKNRMLNIHSALLCGLVLLPLLTGCATNPATGQRQLSLISESQEIEIGKNADRQMVEQSGLYPDEALQDYVQSLGEEMARLSERPELPWHFRVVDDPVVNAFALPGGFIYITRGILAHLGSEAELAGVIGHEIGHVTARHSANQMSKAQLATLGLGIGMVVSEDFRRFGNLAQTGLGLLFLKFGRDDERQADELGFRYASRAGHNPAAMAEVFETLGRVSAKASGGSRLPSWLSTHPDPENRKGRIEAQLGELSPDLYHADWRSARYLDHIDGIVFGRNPREGFVKDGRFYHPELRFQLDVPASYSVQNQKQAVYAISEQQDAVFMLTLAEESSAQQAAQAFFSQQGIESGAEWFRGLGGLPLVSRQFRATSGENVFRGGAAFVELEGHVYRLLSYCREAQWSSRRDPLTRIAASFSRLTDRKLLDVKPMRVEIITLKRDMSLDDFAKQYPSSVENDVLALINHLDPGDVLRAGTRAKRVVGFNPER